MCISYNIGILFASAIRLTLHLMSYVGTQLLVWEWIIFGFNLHNLLQRKPVKRSGAGNLWYKTSMALFLYIQA